MILRKLLQSLRQASLVSIPPVRSRPDPLCKLQLYVTTLTLTITSTEMSAAKYCSVTQTNIFLLTNTSHSLFHFCHWRMS